MNKKKTVELPVEMVENLQEKIWWISSTIVFWHFENIWPTNLIRKICDEMYNSLIHDRIHK